MQTYPGRHAARDKRQVARESPDLSLRIVANVVVLGLFVISSSSMPVANTTTLIIILAQVGDEVSELYGVAEISDLTLNDIVKEYSHKRVQPVNEKAHEFMTQLDALLVSVIKANHGPGGNLERDVPVVGNGKDTLLCWIDDGPLKAKFPRLFTLENKQVTVFDKIHNGFHYGFKRTHRGRVESIQMDKLTNKISMVAFSEDHDRWLWSLDEELKIRRELKDYLEGTMLVSWWIIWNYRNKLIFSSDVPAKGSLYDFIVHYAFVWSNTRGRRKIDMVGWLKCPLTALL
ncbi:hypothetical protein Tco_1108938 [Tanacetum coccineum]